MTTPDRLGPYPITGVIGQGSMGVVYRGFDPQIQRPVAIKTIRRNLLEGSDQGASAAARFKVEAQAAGRLNHPGIVSIYSFGEDPDSAYIVMEYVEGHSLRDYVSRGVRFSEQDILGMMSQLLDALDFAHERGVFHRDIKPANLIVTRDGKLKVTDFGIARIESTELTRANSVIGSPGYMAPEQYTGDVIDRRVDVFSSGVLFYQLLTGLLPFTGTDEAVMFKIIYNDPTPLSQVDGAQGFAHFEPIIAKALAKSPAARYASAREFRQAIIDNASVLFTDSLSVAVRLPWSDAQHGAPAGPRAPSASPAPGNSTSLGSAPGGGSFNGSRFAATPGSVASPGASSTAFSSQRFNTAGPGSGTPPPPTGWDERMLSTLERDLAKFVGPVARVLVRRAARSATDLTQLRQAVAQNITSAADQRTFLGQGTRPTESAPRTGSRTIFGRGTGVTGTDRATQAPRTVAPTPPATSLPITAASLEYATKVLVKRVGPIARLMVKKAATDAISREQMFERLAAEFKVDAEREAVHDELRRFH